MKINGLDIPDDKLAHEYAEIQDDIIWTVATVHIPELIAQLEPLVPQPPGGEQ